jgi:hypothetical protein
MILTVQLLDIRHATPARGMVARDATGMLQLLVYGGEVADPKDFDLAERWFDVVRRAYEAGRRDGAT